MNKKIYIIIINTIILSAFVVLVANISPLVSTQLTNATVFLIKMSSPSLMYSDLKEIISSDNGNASTNNDITTSKNSQSTMNSIGSTDSKDDTNIKDTPSDIKELIKKARAKNSKSTSKGKTSEEAYQGGGTILSYKGVQVQSKIPSSFYNLDIKDLLEKDVKLSVEDKTKPTILIYHSHTTEAYSILDVGYYTSSDARSNDCAKNMVRVGDELAEYLEKQGFVVIHDKKIHDKDYNSSYDDSKKSVMSYLEKYPTIDITIDVHRDDITYSNKTKIKPTAVIDGKKAARMMIISGCEYGKVKNYPDWEENLKFNLQIQNKVEQKYKGLMRPVMFSERKYNMNLTHFSFLLEIGTDANTLDEACYSARLFGNALGELLNEKYVKG